jgi:hypothetical protein
MMKRSIDQISQKQAKDESTRTCQDHVDEAIPKGFRSYLINCLLKRLNAWSVESSRKEIVCSNIVDHFTKEAFSTYTPSDLSTTRTKLKSVIEDFSNILSHKISVIDHLESSTDMSILEEWLKEYKEHHQFNLKVYEDIYQHHKKIKQVDWAEAVVNDEALETYAEAAVVMGSKEWVKAGTDWMHNYIRQFYFEDLGAKLLKKFEKCPRVATASSSAPRILLPVTSDKKIKMLDVGSCFNPFKLYEDLEVTAVDLCPADPSVRRCDFLNITINEAACVSDIFDSSCLSNGDEITPADSQAKVGDDFKFRRSSFNVVVMSLVLSYLPDPQQRITMIRNARSLLSDHSNNGIPGLLLIYEKDSILNSAAYYTTFLEHWKQVVAEQGFVLGRYEHLIFEKNRTHGRKAHVFAFITRPHVTASDVHVPKQLYIKQDFADKDAEAKGEEIRLKLNMPV